MSQRVKIKLMTLTQRQSSKGTSYLYGFLGDTEVIAFKGSGNQWGETWDIYIQERSQKAQQKPAEHFGQQRPSKRDQDALDLFQRPLQRDRG
jgi:hypothetical protein